MDTLNELLQNIGYATGGTGSGLELNIDNLLAEQQQNAYGQGPYLEVVIQPKSSGYRFRYQSEGDSHGGIPGEASPIATKKKTYPTIAIRNYNGPVRVALSLVSHREPHYPHFNQLVGKDVKDGVHVVEISPESNMEACFTNLGIEHAIKKQHRSILEKALLLEKEMVWGIDRTEFGNRVAEIYERNKERVKDPAFIKEVDERLKTLQPFIAKICFRGFIQDDKGDFTQPLLPVYSNEIQDAKAPSCRELKISRISQAHGPASGGTEIILLCDKVQKNDIEIHMFQYNPEGSIGWESFGLFTTADVHHQYAITFKVPPWEDPHTQERVQVQIRLRRKSSHTTFSDSIVFTYMPTEKDNYKIGEKRKKIANFEPNPQTTDFPSLFDSSTFQTNSFYQFIQDVDFNQGFDF